MQNHNNRDLVVHSRTSRLGPRREEVPGAVSHQLRLEINRRQMRRSPAGPIAAGDRFLFRPSANPLPIKYDCFLQIQNDTRARTSPSRCDGFPHFTTMSTTGATTRIICHVILKICSYFGLYRSSDLSISDDVTLNCDNIFSTICEFLEND